ncbi:MAG: RsmB/NOP family class I SAM-dependent RNA methyltransferase [Caulobacteraceae bacterium]|nr:RsmB/NOP family class I SAM-dependent RNA methyltransferase [Caulobacteraceae bacterium]
MTPSARLAAAAEVLDRIAGGRAPAEEALKQWGRENRYAGSKDRRAIADRVYRCLRGKARLGWAMGREDGRALVIGSLALIDDLPLTEIEALFSGEGYAPSPLKPNERARLAAEPGEPPAWARAGLPEFVTEDFKATFGEAWAAEAEALMAPRAPIDLRVNTALATVEAAEGALRAAGLEPERTPWSAAGLRLKAEPPPNVQKLDAFRDGRIEIQDEGSQLAACLAGAAPGQTAVDYCAGGGGKTLVLAQAVGAGGRLVACDVVQKRLDNIRPRLERAGLTAELRLLGAEGQGMDDLEGEADLVLVDAPCSGSGTWRRRPEDAWRLTEVEVERLHALQVAILGRAAKLVRPGGRLAYVTCSMLSRENEASADAFEAARPDFRPRPVADALAAAPLTDAGRDRLSALASGHRLRLSPRAAGTDGFFIALYERTA